MSTAHWMLRAIVSSWLRSCHTPHQEQCRGPSERRLALPFSIRFPLTDQVFQTCLKWTEPSPIFLWLLLLSSGNAGTLTILVDPGLTRAVDNHGRSGRWYHLLCFSAGEDGLVAISRGLSIGSRWWIQLRGLEHIYHCLNECCDSGRRLAIVVKENRGHRLEKWRLYTGCRLGEIIFSSKGFTLITDFA